MTTSRRDFVRNVSLASAGLAIHPNMLTIPAKANPADRVRLAIIGTGFRGQSHLSLALRRSDVDIVAICDVDAAMLEYADKIIKKSGKPAPKVYTGSPHAYRDLLAAGGLDGVIIASPWEWHAPMVLDSLNAGLKYVGTEV